jgi:alkylation response protein AidB-like acyl-CoA dehydrogenase
MFKLAAACLDAQQITNATAYANDRIQFNTAISEFGAILFKLAEMQLLLHAQPIEHQKILKITSREWKEYHIKTELKALKNMLLNYPESSRI